MGATVSNVGLVCPPAMHAVTRASTVQWSRPATWFIAPATLEYTQFGSLPCLRPRNGSLGPVRSQNRSDDIGSPWLYTARSADGPDRLKGSEVQRRGHQQRPRLAVVG